MRTVGIVDAVEVARNTTGECSRKDAVRSVGGESLIGRVVRRISDAEGIDAVAVVISSSADEEVRKAIPADAVIVNSESPDPVARLLAAARALDAGAIVRVDLHSPFVDPNLLDGLITAAEKHEGADYVGYRSSQGNLKSLSQVGLCGEWCRATALQSSGGEADDVTCASASQDLTLSDNPLADWVLSHPDIFQLRFIPVPQPLERDDLRLRLDEQQDWDTAEELIEALDPEELGWRGIASLLNH